MCKQESLGGDAFAGIDNILGVSQTGMEITKQFEMEEQKKNPEGPTVLGATAQQEQWKEECETNNASRKQDKFNTQHHMFFMQAVFNQGKGSSAARGVLG